MTPSEVKTMVNAMGIPSAYYQFAENTGQSPPFICYFFGSSSDFVADNTNYARKERLYIELYTDSKDFVLETTVETVLNANDLVFTKSQDFIDSEKMHVTVYETNVFMEVNTNG